MVNLNSLEETSRVSHMVVVGLGDAGYEIKTNKPEAAFVALRDTALPMPINSV